jgi:MFS family permease
VTLSPYRSVLAQPGVRRLLLFAVLARLPQTAAGVVLTLHVVDVLGRGWAAAGLVGAAATVGMALGGPWRGRMVDKHGLRRALWPSVVAEAAVWGSAPFLGYEGLLVVSFVGGVLGVPVFTVVRQSLAVLVCEDRRRTAFAMDAVGVEVSFILGPTLGVLVATSYSTTAALLGVGVTMVAAGLALIAMNPPTRSPVTDDETPAGAASFGVSGHKATVPRSQWFTPSLVAVLGCGVATVLVLAGTDVSLIAHLRADGAIELSGVIFAAWGVGSIVGGLVYGAVSRPVPPFVLLLGLSLLTIPVGLAPTWWALALAILPAALLCAPVLTATAEAVSRLVPEESRGEAMGWHSSALTVGGAIGAPLAGAVIDASAAWAGLAVVGLVGSVLAVAGLSSDGVLRRVRGPRRSLDGQDAADAVADSADGCPVR